MSSDQVEMMPVQVEQILAACISHIGEIKVPLSALVADYSGKQIFVDQIDDQNLVFRLVDVDEAS